MKIEVDFPALNGGLVLKEVFSGVVFETVEGNRFGVAMRDDTFEVSVMPKGHTKRVLFRVDMQNQTISRLTDEMR